MSELPEGWEVKTVGQLFDIQLGKMLNKKAKGTFPQYPYLGNSNVRWGSFELSELKTMHFSEKEMIKFRLQKGDILLCEGGEVGRCAIWQEETPDIFYQKALHRLRGKNNIIPEYFQLYMQFINGSKLLDDFTSKTSIAHLTREKLTELPVKTPPLPEQRKIAEILSTWDKAIATTEKQIANSKQQKKALMQQLLTGKKRLAGFSGDWEATEVRNLLTESRIPSLYNDPRKRLTVRLNLKGVEHREFRGTESIDSTKHFTRKSGQFIYGKQNIHKGAFGLIPAEFDGFETSQDLPAFDFSETCNAKWFFFYFSREEIFLNLENKMSGTGSKRLNPKSLYKIKLLLPPLPEQQKIAKVLTTADKEISALETRLAHLQQEKKALMQQLLTGKKRVVVAES